MILATNQPCPPPPPTTLTHIRSRALGGEPTLGAQIMLEGASQESRTLTPERMAPTFLPTCPRAGAKGGPVSSSSPWSSPTPRSLEGSRRQVWDRAHKHVSNSEASLHINSEQVKFIFIPGEEDWVGEDLQRWEEISVAVLQFDENMEMPLKWCEWKHSLLLDLAWLHDFGQITLLLCAYLFCLVF